MEDILFCKTGGCTAKLGAGALDRVLSMLQRKSDDNLLVGFDASDDAAVYKISDDAAFVQTLDFFPPMVEDPYIFGQIAATNALSDIYAMGGEVKTALNIVCFPESLDLNVLGKILKGGNEKVMEAGGVLAGGHSIVDEGVKYGLSVTGIVNPERILRNTGCHDGDALILTKPLGVGIICAARRVGEASEEAYEKAVKSMTTLNKYAAEILKNYDVHACTDITGFGLLVHLKEMLGGCFSAVIYQESVPHFEECESYADEFYITGAAQKNRNFMGSQVVFEDTPFCMEEILFDPQTSGGLLVSVPYDEADKLCDEMRNNGINAGKIGMVESRKEYTVKVTHEKW